jgi:glutamine cyclotransferase
MRRVRAVQAAALGTVLWAALLGAGNPSAAQPPAPETHTASEAPEQLRVRVLETLPHDTSAFTQGLEIADGVLYEGTGRSGQSRVTATDLGSGRELARADLPAPYFGEGITLTDTSLWQLTWQHGLAFERDPDSLAERRTVSYPGEGWGLCYQRQADRLVMSDGSDRLTFRDPDTFVETGEVQIPGTDKLNELECTDDAVYANVWLTDTIVRIDPDCGRVTAEIDASGLLTPEEARTANVLNGIAALPATDGPDEFLITGKLWPHLFRVEFVPAG